MRLGGYMYAQGLRFFALGEALFYAPEVIRSIKERYGFVRVPETPDEMMPMGLGKPLVFQHGKYIQELPTGPVPIVVRTLHLYRQGVAVEVNNDITDQCDVILDDFLAWFPLIDSASPLHSYVSRLEVSFDQPIERAWPISTQIGAALARKLGEYSGGSHPADFQVSVLAINRDPGMVFTACDFRIERRDGVPYERNVYFSQAPLATNDHIAVLSEFDRLLGLIGPTTPVASPSEQPPPSSR